MIAVIADDFTGAAEIGGIGLKYGLKVHIETEAKSVSDVDLLVIATDTRSLKAKEASLEIKKITKKLVQLKPDFIYKKLDSVLRGNIADELVAQMETSNKNRSIIVAGNPFLGRIIKYGIYTIDSVPLNQTHFVNDPDFPVKSSSAVEIIGRKAHAVFPRSVDDSLPEKGVIIGDVTNSDEMNKWAEQIDENTIAAGGSGFFDVILNKLYTAKTKDPIGTVYTGKKTLLVSGSTFPKTKEDLEWLSDSGIVTKNMPVEIYNNLNFNPEYFNKWVEDVVKTVESGNKVIISAEHNKSNEVGISLRVKNLIAQLVKEVINRIDLDDLFIEGGATASAILGALKIAILYPCKELAFGIIQMNVNEYPNLCITTKPGSYSWPKNINFYDVTDKMI